jgi:D-alanyl-lipoteichoic acid acyltransferase DltB (MBOAT superfamily)
VIFHSLDYALFLSAFLILYWSLRHRGQNWLLWLGSYVFYGYVHPWYVALLAGSSVADYLYALGMERYKDDKIAPALRGGAQTRKRLLLICSLCTNLGLLSFFKYCNFFLDSAFWLGERAGVHLSRPELHVLLPVGISF